MGYPDEQAAERAASIRTLLDGPEFRVYKCPGKNMTGLEYRTVAS